MPPGYSLSLNAFVRLVVRMRRGDQAAAELLWGIIKRWIASSRELVRLAQEDPDRLDDAASHVLFQIWSGKWHPSRSRSLAAVRRWVRVTARRRILDTFSPPGVQAADKEFLDGVPAPNRPAEESLSREKLKRIARMLREIDRVVFHHLTQVRGSVEWYALYLLEGRIGLYNSFRACDDDTAQPGFAWIHLVQAYLPWSTQDRALRVRPSWPTIADIWAAVSASVGPEGLAITSGRLIEAVKALAPRVRASAQVHYKWRERLRAKLAELLDNGAFDGIDPEAVTLWRAIYGV